MFESISNWSNNHQGIIGLFALIIAVIGLFVVNNKYKNKKVKVTQKLKGGDGSHNTQVGGDLNIRR